MPIYKLESDRKYCGNCSFLDKTKYEDEKFSRKIGFCTLYQSAIFPDNSEKLVRSKKCLEKGNEIEYAPNPNTCSDKKQKHCPFLNLVNYGNSEIYWCCSLFNNQELEDDGYGNTLRLPECKEI
jgi:hypothetical protein